MSRRLSLMPAMRARAAVLIFAAWICFIHAETQGPGKILNSKKENLRHLASCVESFGLSKCVGAYGLWRAEKALGNFDSNLFFPWSKYSNLTDEELYTKLCEDTERLLQKRPLSMNIADNYSLQLGVTQNGSFSIDLNRGTAKESGRGSMKKMQKMIKKMLPLFLIPGLIMSAVLPFFLPTLKMMTLGAGMLNNMALSGAIFTLLRNNAFDDTYRKKIIYINDGYHNEEHQIHDEGPSEVIVDPYDSKFNGFETHDFRDYHLFETNPLFSSPTQFTDLHWLKPPDEKVKNVEILNESIESEWANSHNIHSKVGKGVKKRTKT